MSDNPAICQLLHLISHQLSQCNQHLLGKQLEIMPSQTHSDKMVAPGGSSTSMPFIVSRSADKADAATRKLIRSHVMRGKKQNRLRPSKRQLQLLEKEQSRTKSARPARHVRVVPVGTEELQLELICHYAAPIPRRVGSDFSFVEFADDIEPEMVLNVMKCWLSTYHFSLSFHYYGCF
jgi:hypothetical protein